MKNILSKIFSSKTDLNSKEKYFLEITNRTKVSKLFKVFSNFSDLSEIRYVGGCVRNFLKSKKIDDIDIATIFSPDQIKIKLSGSNFRVIDTGIEHGSVTVVANNKKFELTTLRKDLKTDGRHADIEIIDNWQEDSKRRDFTINAIYLNKKGNITYNDKPNFDIYTKFLYWLNSDYNDNEDEEINVTNLVYKKNAGGYSHGVLQSFN